MKLEIRFSWEQRINNHDIPKYTLYQEDKPVYSAQYESCVFEYINNNYAKKASAYLKRRLEKLGDEERTLRNQIYDVQRLLSKPLTIVIRNGILE